MSAVESCKIWGTSYPATVYFNQDPSYAIVDSPRAGGRYKCFGDASVRIGDLDPKALARLTTWLVDQRMRGDELPEVTAAVVDLVNTKRPLAVHIRTDRLLQFLSNLTSVVGEFVGLGTPAAETDSFGHRAMLEGPTFWKAMAVSESIHTLELQFLINNLLEKGWIKGQREGLGMGHFTVTIDGYSHVADQVINVDSSQAFVALWFHDSMDAVSEKGIEPAILEAGYKPLRVDRKEHINKIDDEILAEIRRSRFLVADFTHGEDGARGSVYYEAGFAHGLGLPVIFTCQGDSAKTLHFDTNHYNHIVWTTPADLRERLKNRILAVMGEGPKIQTNPLKP